MVLAFCTDPYNRKKKKDYNVHIFRVFFFKFYLSDIMKAETEKKMVVHYSSVSLDRTIRNGMILFDTSQIFHIFTHESCINQDHLPLFKTVCSVFRIISFWFDKILSLIPNTAPFELSTQVAWRKCTMLKTTHRIQT